MCKILAIHAFVQFGNPSANAEWICRQLRGCAQLAPDLVVTPELALTGHPMLNQRLPWDALATESAIDLVAHTADELGIAVLLGTLHSAPHYPAPTNALLLLNKGQRTLVCEKHRQRHLPEGHSLVDDYAYGVTREGFMAGDMPCAPLICAESVDPDIVAAVKGLQPGLVVHPSAWGADDGEPYALTAARESLFQAELVLVVNQTGAYLGQWPHAETFVYQRGEVLALAKGPEPRWLLLETEAGRQAQCRVLPAAA